MYVKSHKIYSRDYQDDGESRFSPYDSVRVSVFCLWLSPMDGAEYSHPGSQLTCVFVDMCFPFLFFSESSEEESTGEREEEICAHDEVTSSTKTTEVPAEQTSNTQAGERLPPVEI